MPDPCTNMISFAGPISSTSRARDTCQVRSEIPSSPGPDDWLRWDIEVLAELQAGKQSRVFDALLNGERSAIKLTESRLTNIAVLTSRMAAAEALGASHLSVVAPTRIDGALV